MPGVWFEHDNKHQGIGRLKRARGFLSLLCLLGVLLVTGCQVSVGNQTRPLVRAAPIRGSVELDAYTNKDKQKTSNTDITNKSMEMRELLRLQTEGDIYHPNLLLYDAMVAFGLSQSRFNSDGEVFTDQSSVSEYHFGGRLFPVKPYPSSFYLDRNEDVVPRYFGSPLNIESESRGFTQSLDFENWPMTFSYNDYYTRQEGSGTSEDRDFFQIDEKTFNYTLQHDFSDLSKIGFEFDRRQVNQKRFNSDTDRQDDRFTVRHTHFFDEEKRYRFESYFDYLEQTKDFDLEQTLWTERLRIRHTERFETFYNLLYSESNRAESSNDRTRLEAGFLHRLYESLNTTGLLYTSENNDNDITEDTWGGDLSFDYTKRNPWGRLQASYFVGYEDLDRSGGSVSTPVIDEPHPYTRAGSGRFFLDNPNVQTPTIIIWDSSRTKFYIQGPDYTVREINGLTEIRIQPAGEIFNDGDQILRIDYNYAPEGERQEESLTQVFTIRQVFYNGVGIYYEYHIRDQDITTNEPEFIPDEYVKNIFGIDYTKGGLLLEAEYRDEDTTRLPLTRKSLSGSYLWPLDPDTQLNVFASNDWIEYTEESNEIVQFTIGGGIYSRLSDRYSLVSNIVYRDEDDDQAGRTQGFDWSTELKYTFRQFSYTSGLQMSSLDHLDQETDNLFLYFRARRDF